VLAVVSGRLDLDPASDLFRGGAERTIVITHESSNARTRDRLAEVADVVLAGIDQVDVRRGLDQLVERGLTRVLCEGGGRLAAALIEDDLVDEIVCYTAGLALGSEAIPSVGNLEVSALQLAPRFRLIDSAAVGPDLRSRWRRRG
jgi:diaminohydroxyphosphoribosylaminopyrimidine deaminase/5-amino-6-(5-phosphoribosylamino)uracil reductase